MAEGLDRFVAAQDRSGAFDLALSELRAGCKVSHWMWFVFPQLAGLGRSATSQHFAIVGVDEARAYLAHPVLGSRLRMCAGILAEHKGHDAATILGTLDALKLRSSMTLFLRADPDESLFQAVLDRYFDGQPDPATDRLLRNDPGR
jgi:uncharacterized protein (DUF1810 family)